MASNLKAQLERTTFGPDELISLASGPEHEEQFRKYTLPQRHRLLEKLRRKDQGCVFLTGLPFGMTESALRKFMAQFGDVIRCIVHRCPKSGKSRGYGYVHFRYSQVADVAASTMNNYLLLGNIIKCKLIAGKFIKEKSFRQKDPKFHQRMNTSIKQINSKKTASKEKKSLARRRAVAMRQLEKLGGALQPEELPGLEVPTKEAKSPKKAASTNKSPKVKSNKPKVKKVKVTKSNRPLLQNKVGSENTEVESELPAKTVSKTTKTIKAKKSSALSASPKAARVAKPKSKPQSEKIKAKAALASPMAARASPKAARVAKPKSKPQSQKVMAKAALASPKAALASPKAARASPKAARASPKAARVAKPKSKPQSEKVKAKATASKTGKKLKK